MLKKKIILVLSPQAWGKMFLSKHHYAVELARQGNTVYFLNPPNQNKTGRNNGVDIKRSSIHPDLYIIEHELFFSYNLKFRFISVFHWLMGIHLKRLIKSLPTPIDIVWSFDLGNLYPLAHFRNSYRIFHPVDEPLNKPAIRAAKGANIIFSVTQEILDKYASFPIPKHFIHHGVTEKFFHQSPLDNQIVPPIRIGFSGNLLRSDIDRETLLAIIQQNKDCVFEFWGSYTQAEGNIGGVEDDAVKQFIKSLENESHVVLHGPISSDSLAESLKRMDAFLICYDIKQDQSKGTNYHKIMEYLATGKVIISNNVTTFRDQPSLIQMAGSRENNGELPELFRKVINELPTFNSPANMKTRIAFASDNTYQKQVQRIEQIIYHES